MCCGLEMPSCTDKDKYCLSYEALHFVRFFHISSCSFNLTQCTPEVIIFCTHMFNMLSFSVIILSLKREQCKYNVYQTQTDLCHVCFLVLISREVNKGVVFCSRYGTMMLMEWLPEKLYLTGFLQKCHLTCEQMCLFFLHYQSIGHALSQILKL